MNFFTKETCTEVINVLTDDQLSRECTRYLKMSKKGDTLKTPDAQRKYLLNRASKLADSNDVNVVVQTALDINESINTTVTDSCNTLIQTITEELLENRELISNYHNEINAFKLEYGKLDFQTKFTDNTTVLQTLHKNAKDFTDLSKTVDEIRLNVEHMMNNGLDLVYPDNCSTNSTTAAPDFTSPNDISVEGSDNDNNMSKSNINEMRVLILTDSRNLNFDVKYLKSPIKCTTYPMYHLNHITQVEPLIAESDLVLISSGVNDITQWRADGAEVADFMISFLTTARQKFPNTQFLFNSIAPTNLVANINDAYLRHIHTINRDIFNHCITSPNATFFDNENLDWDHISNDGIHLTPAGKKSLSKCWVNVILRCFGFRRGPVPLRPSFRNIAYRYY